MRSGTRLQRFVFGEVLLKEVLVKNQSLSTNELQKVTYQMKRLYAANLAFSFDVL